jgi:hypothetical protein
MEWKRIVKNGKRLENVYAKLNQKEQNGGLSMYCYALKFLGLGGKGANVV